MDSLPKEREILLDEDINEQEFVNMIACFYKQECFIYAIIPNWEEELLNELSNQFIRVKDVTLPRTFPRTTGYLGYVRDSEKQFIYEFYLRSTTMDIVYSEVDVIEKLDKIDKKNVDIYNIFELNKISHVTIGPDGQWLNVVEY